MTVKALTFDSTDDEFPIDRWSLPISNYQLNLFPIECLNFHLVPRFPPKNHKTGVSPGRSDPCWNQKRFRLGCCWFIVRHDLRSGNWGSGEDYVADVYFATWRQTHGDVRRSIVGVHAVMVANCVMIHDGVMVGRWNEIKRSGTNMTLIYIH